MEEVNPYHYKKRDILLTIISEEACSKKRSTGEDWKTKIKRSETKIEKEDREKAAGEIAAKTRKRAGKGESCEPAFLHLPLT